MVKIKDNKGGFHPVREVLDNGSQSNFISEELVQRLKLKRRKTAITLQAFGELTSQADTSVSIEIHSTANNYHFNMECIILLKISGNILVSYIDHKDWNLPEKLTIADPDIHIPQSTDIILIGAQFFLPLLKPERKTRPKYPILQNTHLGWILSEEFPRPHGKNNKQPSQVLFVRSYMKLENKLQKFWKLEELYQPVLSEEEKKSERYFQKTITRDDSGRYIVDLSIKDEIQLGSSRQAAEHRFNLLERRLQSNECLRKDYINFMREYEQLGHMKEVKA